MPTRRTADLLREAVSRLLAAEVPSPRLDASLMLSNVLAVPRHVLATEPDRHVARQDAERFRALVEQRARRRPLSHVLGRTEFWSLEMRVTDATLAPRPETEMLVAEAVAFLRGRPGAVAADVGTGTGCIAVALLTECPRLHVHAVDIDQAAILVACENAARHGVLHRLTVHHGDLLAPVAAGVAPASLDLVVSNPPYVRHAERDSVDPEVLWEPAGAVFCDGEPCETYGAIAREAAPLVRPGGLLLLELPGDDPQPVADAVAHGGAWEGVRVRPDLAGLPRMLSAVRAEA